MAARIGWAPQPGPQARLVKCPVFEILYGGARGGGKTDGMLGKNAIKAQQYGAHQKGIFFRRELPQLEAAIDRSKELYYPMGATWAEQKKLWTFRNGATLRFRPLERDADAEKYQGHDYTDLYFEELTNYPDPKPVMKLKGTLRSAAGVPCQWHATANPGGPGHAWVKARYIDPAPQGFELVKDDDGMLRVFIPAKLNDNQLLTRQDPHYISRLKQSGSEQLVRAWLDGDWNVIEGAFFDCWSQDMILRPFEIPEHWATFLSFDWGSARPFSVGWWAVASEDYIHQGKRIPRGALVRFREWYGASAPNVGLKMTAEAVSAGIQAKGTERLGVADPAIFAEDGGPSLAERMNPVFWKRADNKRVAGHGRIGGWDQMRARMVGEDGRPMLYCFSTCVDSIRTIPILQHDANKAEDLDTSAEDHAADEWRYACMSRPYVGLVDPEEKPEKLDDYVYDEPEQDGIKLL